MSQNGVVQPFGNTVPVYPNVPYTYPTAGGAYGNMSNVMKNIPGGYVVARPFTATSVANAANGYATSTITTQKWFSAYNKGRVSCVPPPIRHPSRPLIPRPSPGALPINLNAAVSSVALCGTLLGQLFFGWAGDKFGRKSVCAHPPRLAAPLPLSLFLSFPPSQTA